jgi:FkbM family methyltransferase
MLSITTARKRRLCERLLEATGATIGFADVGSGGPLKRPWSLLPPGHVRKFDFEPTGSATGALPLCVSNRDGQADFFVARDERASSFHRALPQFAERYGMQSLFATHTITVSCITLDRYFDGRLDVVDALDVNVEGHDFQVLEGGRQLLERGSLKLLKVEFELAAVWEGQGWLSDIDPLLRRWGYELAGIDIDFARPVSVQHCFHRGEPLWGKALYVPGSARWVAMLDRAGHEDAALAQALAKGIALCVAADAPGRALDLLELPCAAAALGPLDAGDVRARVGALYRWAKLERGCGELWQLATRALGVRGSFSEA